MSGTRIFWKTRERFLRLRSQRRGTTRSVYLMCDRPRAPRRGGRRADDPVEGALLVAEVEEERGSLAEGSPLHIVAGGSRDDHVEAPGLGDRLLPVNEWTRKWPGAKPSTVSS